MYIQNLKDVLKIVGVGFFNVTVFLKKHYCQFSPYVRQFDNTNEILDEADNNSPRILD